ncbi:MAG: hypothetical protein ABJB47_17635 [Actinomycetota bacterium]
MAAALFLGAGWGIARIMAAQAQGLTIASPHDRTALAALAGTGVLLGILVAVPRVSPLSAGLPGLVLVAWSVYYVVSTHRALQLILLHRQAAATGFTAMLVTGLLGLLGIAMVIPLFVPSRWRRAPGGEEDDGDDGYADMPTAIGLTG